MLHLLTEEHRQKVVHEYKMRIAIVCIFGLLFVTLIGAVFILPTFFLAHEKYSELLVKKQMLDVQLASNEETKSSEVIKSTTSSLDVLKIFSQNQNFSESLMSVIGKVPQGIKIQNSIVTSSDKETLVIDIAGKADTRKNLVIFEQQLKNIPNMQEVIIPLSSFAKEKNIDFSIKIILSNEK